ncbi:MAG TPA: polysaccharide biosynthesis C-terminal domain-containing protein [Thermoplasmata archaeon]|nr:polysaccharide biosynthesis C-terminal domain-containing protein [Thermoplasmata archaeon]
MDSDQAGNLKSGFTTVTVGTLFLLVSTLVLVGFISLARVLIVRTVSTSAWDAFSLGFTLTQVLLSIGSLGIPVAVARLLPSAARDAERRTVVRTALAVGSGAAVVGGVSLLLAGPALGRLLGSPLLGSGLGYFALVLSSLIVATLLASIFQGFANVTPNAVFLQIVNPGLFLGFLTVALVIPPHRVTYTDALVAYATAAATTLAALVVYATRRLPRTLVRGPGETGARGRLLRLAAPLCVYGAMVSVAGSGDTLILGVFHFVEVGTYSASLTLARLVQVGISAASYIFLPVASGFLARGNRRAVSLTYVTVTKWLTVLSLPLFLVFVFLPSASLDFVYGARYSGVVLPLQLVVASAFVGTLLGPAAMAQVVAGQARLLALNAIVAATADVGVALLLVPRYGEDGAAAAWAAANVLYGALCLGELAAAEGYHPFRRDFVVPLVVTAVPLGLVLFVVHPAVPLLALPVIAVAIAVAFAFIVVATGSVDEGDRLLLGAVEHLLGRPVPFVRRWAAVLRRSAR